MNADIVWQQLRFVLMFLGGMAVTAGWLTSEQLIGLVGAIGTIFIMAWGAYVKWSTRSVPEQVAKREDVPIVSQATGTIIPGPAYTDKK